MVVRKRCILAMREASCAAFYRPRCTESQSGIFSSFCCRLLLFCVVLSSVIIANWVLEVEKGLCRDRAVAKSTS